MNESTSARSAFGIRVREWDVFISHAHDDAAIARALAAALGERGFSVWHGEENLRLGEPIRLAIDHAIRSAAAVIVLLSAASLSSSSVHRELEVALEGRPQSELLLVAVGEVDVRRAPSWLAARRWLYLRDVHRVGKLIDKLLPALNAASSNRSNDTGRAQSRGDLPPRTAIIGGDDHLRRLCAQHTGITWIVGGPGAGKTVLAREYAHQIRDDVDFIWWFSPVSPPPHNLRLQLQALERELGAGDRGLIVIDALDARTDVSPVIQHHLAALSKRHRLVITTRRMKDTKSWGDQRSTTVLALSPMSREDIFAYLDAFAPELRPDERAKLTQIAASAGGSPLLLRSVVQALQSNSSDSVLSAAATGGSLQILLSQLSDEERYRLHVLAFYAGFLRNKSSKLRWSLPGDESLLDRLAEWGLCSVQNDGAVVLPEPLTDILRVNAPRRAFEECLADLASQLPDPHEPIPQSDLSAIAELTHFAEDNLNPATFGDLVELLIWQGSVWLASGKPERAELIAQQAFAVATESDQVMLQIRALNLQSALAFDRGQIEEANSIELRVVELAANKLGTEHPIFISSLANHATTRRAQGDLAEAITLLRQAVDFGRRALREDHPDVTTAKVNLAVCLRDAGMAHEALDLLEEVNRYTDDDRMRLQVEQIRAVALMDLGRLSEAEIVLLEVLSSADRTGLSETPEALAIRANLARLYAMTGQLDDALAVQEEVVEQFDVVYGPDHLASLGARSNYAGLLTENGSFTEAHQLFSSVAASRTRLLGPDHPDTLQSTLRVATTAGTLGDDQQSLALFSELLPRVVRVLGPDHLMSFGVREEYARELNRAGDIAGARLAFRELLADLKRTLSPGHPMTKRVAEACRGLGEDRAAVSRDRRGPGQVAWDRRMPQ
ncbi:tetratricopeptide repeat protein [Paenarthrobacter sp. FR1]|uniref:tetratricopeptide repeat protein n=1 Tax=Paenarthrobacter sp. FR1 TaxID=3439548 RepID=UPI003DA3D445